MKINVKALVEISEEERKRIVVDYLESLLHHSNTLVKREGHYYWFEEVTDARGKFLISKEKGPATNLEIKAHQLLQELKRERDQ